MTDNDTHAQALQSLEVELPDTLMSFWNEIKYGVLTAPAEIFAVFQSDIPDEQKQLTTLLRCYEAGAIGLWWQNTSLPHNIALVRLIDLIADTTINTYIMRDDVELPKIARYLSQTKRIRHLALSARKRLLTFCMDNQPNKTMLKAYTNHIYNEAVRNIFGLTDIAQPDSTLFETNQSFVDTLLETVFDGNDNQNILLSPYSILYSLFILYLGADTSTKQQLQTLLQLPDTNDDVMFDANSAVHSFSTTHNPYVTLIVQCALWIDHQIQLNQETAERLQTYYQTSLNTLDFASPTAPQTINRWVADTTQGRISHIVDACEPLEKLSLTQVIYFKARWESIFNPAGNQTFYLLDGSSKQTLFMEQTSTYRYFATDDYEAIAIPYKESEIQMEIYLPQAHVPLDISHLKTWSKQFRAVDNNDNLFAIRHIDGRVIGIPYGQIEMPYFTFNYHIELRAVLRNLGLSHLFDPAQADFTRFVSSETIEPVWLTQLLQHTFIRVDNLGTEAAAITHSRLAAGAMMPPKQTFHMVVNRPFMFTIFNRTTGNTLFTGVVVEPFWNM